MHMHSLADLGHVGLHVVLLLLASCRGGLKCLHADAATSAGAQHGRPAGAAAPGQQHRPQRASCRLLQWSAEPGGPLMLMLHREAVQLLLGLHEPALVCIPSCICCTLCVLRLLGASAPPPCHKALLSDSFRSRHTSPADRAERQDDFDWKADYLAWKRDTGFSFCAAHGCALLFVCVAAACSLTLAVQVTALLSGASLAAPMPALGSIPKIMQETAASPGCTQVSYTSEQSWTRWS